MSFFSALPIIIWNWLEKPGQTKIYHPSRLVLLSCLVYKTNNVLFFPYSKAVSRCVIRLLRCTRYRVKTLYSEDSNPRPSCLVNADVLRVGDTYGLMAISQSSIFNGFSFYPQFGKNTKYTFFLKLYQQLTAKLLTAYLSTIRIYYNICTGYFVKSSLKN